MKTERIKVRLEGGTHDGKKVWVWRGQPFVCMAKQITQAEMDNHQISEGVAWKFPEEIYMLSWNADTIYRYARTVEYKAT